MIYYFSATGNSQHVAERLAATTGDTLVSITACAKAQHFNLELRESERLCFVTPVYFGGLPTIVADFISRLKITPHGEHYVYSVITYGTTTGQASKQLAGLLGKKATVNAKFAVRMVDTWTPMFDLSDKRKIEAITQAAEPQIDVTIKKVSDRQSGDFDKRKIPLIAPLVYRMYGKARKTKRFDLLPTCMGCGVCSRQCPVSAITILDKKAVWVKDECVLCLGCLHHCPKFAIQYGKNTQKHGQFVYPKK